MINALRNRYAAWRKARAVRDLRSHMMFFGFDLSCMTDEGVEAMVVRMSKAIAGFGVTYEEAVQGFANVSKALAQG